MLKISSRNSSVSGGRSAPTTGQSGFHRIRPPLRHSFMLDPTFEISIRCVGYFERIVRRRIRHCVSIRFPRFARFRPIARFRVVEHVAAVFRKRHVLFRRDQFGKIFWKIFAYEINRLKKFFFQGIAHREQNVQSAKFSSVQRSHEHELPSRIGLVRSGRIFRIHPFRRTYRRKYHVEYAAR